MFIEKFDANKNASVLKLFMHPAGRLLNHCWVMPFRVAEKQQHHAASSNPCKYMRWVYASRWSSGLEVPS